jgi:hypothetical protein
MIRNSYFFLLFFAFPALCVAQTLPVGALLENVEDAYRRQQLLGTDSSRTSFMIRPMNLSNKLFDSKSNTLVGSRADFRKELYLSPKGRSAIYALPVVWTNQYTTNHPYSINDGSMIPAKGYQTQLSAGVFGKIGPLSIQLRPEVIFAQNSDYRELNETGKLYNGFYNRIDLPSRYGNGNYSKINWGQSNIRLTFDPVSFGLSNENLWWGPGIKNSLLMSNNATGFKHLTLNTSRPINTPIGSFETQIIAGRLERSGYEVSGPGYQSNRDDWRYLSGIAFTYQPKWIKNLFLGFDRAFVIYHKDIQSGFSNYFPLFASGLKYNFTIKEPFENTDDLNPRDQYISAFARWVLPESKTEFYFQLGRNDASYDLRDLILEPESSRAYIVGMQKLFPLVQQDAYIQLAIELSQLQGPNVGLVRSQPNWYSHYQVRAGYTNEGQVLGAGIGPNANQQSLSISWVKGLNKIGLDFDHLYNNVELARKENDERQNWIDVAFGAHYDWQFKHFILNSKLTYIHSNNYQYLDERANNLQFKVGFLYNFQSLGK